MSAARHLEDLAEELSTRKEIKARSGLDNTNSVSTALRTLERLGLASSPSWGFWRAA